MDFNNNPSLYPKEKGLNLLTPIIERINILEGMAESQEDSFETKELNVTENAEIENLHATEGTIDTLQSTTATVATLNSTTADIKNVEVEELNVTETAQIENLSATEGTVTTLNSTTADIENADIENIDVTEGTVDTLQSTTATVTDLNATNADIENADIENLDVTEEIKLESLKTEEPILSNAVVGYDENGKMIPIRFVAPTESSLYFDYTVDSQQKFNDLLTILKSGVSTYRSIAILGGLGDGDHGEYLYTVYSNSSEVDFNDASFIGFNNPKIVITTSNANTLKVFKNGSIKDIDFSVGGTVTATETVTLFYNCTYDNGNIALNNTSANFNIVNTTLSNVVNDVIKSFSGCTLNDCTTNVETTFTSCNLNKGSVTDSCEFTSCELNDYSINDESIFQSCSFINGSVNGICNFNSCNLNNILIDDACNFVYSTLKDCKNTKRSSFTGCSLNFCTTVQSIFYKCNSEMLYVSTDTNIAGKYSFNKCGIHLDMKKSNTAQVETVTINISSMTDTKLSVLDNSSNLKKIVLNVDASDTLSEIIGNNDKKYSIYEPFVGKVYKSVSPSMRTKAYLSIYDESHTPIFSNDETTFYIDEAMTQEVGCYETENDDGEPVYFFMLENESPRHAYSSLAFNEELTWVQFLSDSSFGALKLSDYADEFILNGNSLKTYIFRNDESGTLLYSNDNGTNIYISPDINNVNKVEYVKINNTENVFTIGDSNYTKTLRACNIQPSVSSGQTLSNILLEVTPLKDNYAVQVVSNYDVPIYVENAFSTKIKNT